MAGRRLNPNSDAWGGAWGSASAWGGTWGWSWSPLHEVDEEFLRYEQTYHLTWWQRVKKKKRELRYMAATGLL